MSAPKTPTPRRPDHHYDFRGMNLVFALSSLALLAVTLWMVFEDYAKPWKRWQAEFRDRERQALVEEAEVERQRISGEEIATIERDIAQQQERLGTQRGEIEEIEDELAGYESKVYELDAEWRKTKSLLDTARYEYGEAVQRGDDGEIAEHRAEVDELQERFRQDKIAVEEATRMRDEAKAKVAARRADLVAAEERLAALEQGLTTLQDRVAVLDKDLDYFVLNAPLFDFLEPSLKIEQALLTGLYNDINFTTVNRVDRCMTCHVAANRPGFVNAADGNGAAPAAAAEPAGDGEIEWPQPFQSHPRLDLYVGDTSPHPYGRFGCTVCHSGLDRSTEFARVGHSPTSEQQREHWEEEYDWEPQKYLDYPILPTGMAEAGCLSCHASEVWTPESQVLDSGRKLINKMGCYGCHVIDYPAFTDLRKAGPDLTAIAAKTDPGWAYRWIEAPRDFRPTTWMPHFFYLQNIKGELNMARQQAEMVGLVDFLWERSEELDPYPVPPPGDPAAGEVLFESVGCTGCHILDRDAERADFFPEIERLHGPNLVRTGSKVSPGWLYAWIKDPKQYFPETNMPRLRLTDREAADLTAYLSAQRDPAYENLAVPAADAAARDGLVLEYLQQKLTIAQSQARLEQMSERERSVYLGEQTVIKYGCYGCHTIGGFEDAKPIGIELTQEGSKPLHQFDFGHVHEVPHTRHDWIHTKLKEPRIWDHGKEEVKSYGELYKMPNFGMTDEEAQAVLVNVLAFDKESVRPERKAGQDPETEALAGGRKLVTRYNCQGCHLIEGEGRAIAGVMERDLLPPNLAAEGARTQADWLFSFLHDPGQVTLRPWLTVRMPTFDFSDQQANTLISYFAALDDREPFASQPQTASARDLAVGEVAFTMLQCARCHPAGPQAASSAAASAAELAPSLLLAPERLRYDWVASWIKDPTSWIPGTNMPTNFPHEPDGSYSSPFEFVFGTPTFEPNKRVLMRHFASEEELEAYLTDADKVTKALRDHIWTLR